MMQGVHTFAIGLRFVTAIAERLAPGNRPPGFPGTGSKVMQRIAAPMVGGMITAPLLSMFVIRAAYYLMRRPRECTRARWSFATTRLAR